MKDGGSAFPELSWEYTRDGESNQAAHYTTGGLSIRDYVAARVYPELVVLALKHHENTDNWKRSFEQYAADAYFAADAFLQVREKSGG